MSIYGLYQKMFKYQMQQPMLFALLIFSVFGAVLFQCLQPVIVEWLINKVISSQDTFLLAIAISLLSINFYFLSCFYNAH